MNPTPYEDLKHSQFNSNQTFSREDTRLGKRSISAKALLEDISTGLSDAELMDRHELSHAQLQKILAQLLKAGYIGREVLDGRRQAETKSSSVEFEGTDVPVMATESRSAQPPRPVQSRSHSPVLMDDESRHSGTAKSSSSSLPYSREQAARFRRNGLILILASFGFMTMMIILSKLREGVEGGVFPNDGEGLALNSIAALGWLVTAIWGCFWRLRGPGASWRPFLALIFLWWRPCPTDMSHSLFQEFCG
jgi:hypothetical protein